MARNEPEIHPECSCAIHVDEFANEFWVVDSCPIHRQLNDEQMQLALKCANAYRAEIAFAYLNDSGVLCVVCDLWHDEHRDGFMFVDNVCLEFDPDLDDLQSEELHHVV